MARAVWRAIDNRVATMPATPRRPRRPDRAARAHRNATLISDELRLVNWRAEKGAIGFLINLAPCGITRVYFNVTLFWKPGRNIFIMIFHLQLKNFYLFFISIT